MATKPREYRMDVRGFGTWRIGYDPAVKKWLLALNSRIKGERWQPAGHFEVAESAAVAVGERATGLGVWDNLGFGRELNCDLSHWKTEASEGVQADAES